MLRSGFENFPIGNLIPVFKYRGFDFVVDVGRYNRVGFREFPDSDYMAFLAFPNHRYIIKFAEILTTAV
jgi:hypothetical protein